MNSATLRNTCGAMLCALLATAPAFAATIDGTLDGDYGVARSVQTTQTQFGDANIGQMTFANGSEIDGAFASFSGGPTLNLLFTGNLESNFNKIEIFIDCIDGGQNVLLNNNPNVDFDGLNRMAGLKFDAAFAPDFYITATGGDVGGGTYKMFANYAELLSGGGGAGGFLAGTDAGGYNGGPNFKNIEFTINNGNTGGVSGGCDAASGAGVQTGVELAIPFAAIGNPTGCIRVCAFINGSSHDFLANQVVGPLPAPTCNLGEPSLVDFSALAGDQFFEICDNPTPVKNATWGRVKALYR